MEWGRKSPNMMSMIILANSNMVSSPINTIGLWGKGQKNPFEQKVILHSALVNMLLDEGTRWRLYNKSLETVFSAQEAQRRRG